MRKIILITILVVVGAVFFGLSEVADAATSGEKLYKGTCAACHGMKGEGSALAPALKGNEFLEKATVEELMELITKGRGREDKRYPKFPIPMPAHPRFTDEELKTLIEYKKTHILTGE